MDEQGGIPAVVHEHVGAGLGAPVQGALGGPPVLLQSLALGWEGARGGASEGVAADDGLCGGPWTPSLPPSPLPFPRRSV